MTAYVIAAVDVQDRERYERYRSQVAPIVEAAGGRFLVRGGAQTVMEGSWASRTVVIAFPSRDAALTFYWSAAYQAILPDRLGASEGDLVIVDGIEAA